MKKVSILLGAMALFASNSDAALQDLPGWGEGSASCSLSSRQVPQHQGYYGDLLQCRQGPGERDRRERLTEEHAVIQSLIPLLNSVSALLQVLNNQIVVQPATAQVALVPDAGPDKAGAGFAWGGGEISDAGGPLVWHLLRQGMLIPSGETRMTSEAWNARLQAIQQYRVDRQGNLYQAQPFRRLELTGKTLRDYGVAFAPNVRW